MTALAILATFPAAATPYFAAFWLGFEFWRRHVALTFLLMFTIVGGFTITLIVLRDPLFADALAMPLPARLAGWAIIAASFVLSVVADRQLGLRVRAFLPFFEDDETIELRTTGAYAIVRHPIYASGAYFQLGAFLVTGVYTIALALVVFTLGALWFTRQEERRLRGRLADPGAYDRYRARVPALFPWPRSARE